MPAGGKLGMVGIQGEGGAPKALLSGPGGKHISASVDGISTDGGALVVRQPATGQTLVEIPNAGAGKWTAQALPGSAPVKLVETAHSLPAPVIRASVTGRGAHRVLRYRATRQPGLSIRFLEGVDGGAQPIGSAGAAKGTIHFTPAVGSGRTRTIIARITRNGLAAGSIVVGRYNPGAISAGRASRIRVTHTHAGWRITWRPGVLATEQLLTVRFVDGAQVLLRAKGAQRSVTLAHSIDAGAQPTAVEILAKRGQTPGRPAFAVARRVRGKRRH